MYDFGVYTNISRAKASIPIIADTALAAILPLSVYFFRIRVSWVRTPAETYFLDYVRRQFFVVRCKDNIT